MNKKIMASLFGGSIMLGMTFQTQALPIFTVTPGAIDTSPLLPGTLLTSFQADSINATTAGLITLNSNTNTATETGYIQVTNFQNGANVIQGVQSGLGIDYSLYFTYNIGVSLLSGTFGGLGSSYKLDSLSFSLFADVGNQLNPATATIFNVGSTTVAPSVTNQGTVKNIASGVGIIPSPLNSVNITTGGGVALNSLTTFALTSPFGPAFFSAPNPFYNLTFDAFTNTGPGVTPGTGYPTGVPAIQALAAGCPSGTCTIAVNPIPTTIDFQGVPEPTTVALLGIGLLGAAGASQRRKV